MTEEILRILDKKVIELDGVKIEVELRMIKNTWGRLAFKPYAKFGKIESPLNKLKERYNKDFIKGIKE